MNQPPSLWRLISSLWLQNFRLKPVATLAGSAVFILMVVGLFFAGAFFFVGFIVIAAVLAIFQRFFGGGVSRSEPPRANQNRTTSKTTIEGDYSVIEDRAAEHQDSDDTESKR